VTAPAAAPAPPPAAPPVPAAVPKLPVTAKKLKLCPLRKPRPRYRVVHGKRVKVKPAACRRRHTVKVVPRAKAGARGGPATAV
jgi:hypothetical protein